MCLARKACFDNELRFGRVVTPYGDYGDASVVGKLYMVQVEQTGPYHIDLRGYDFDAYLVLRDDFGDVLTEDDDGFVLTHARLDLAELRTTSRCSIARIGATFRRAGAKSQLKTDFNSGLRLTSELTPAFGPLEPAQRLASALAGAGE